MSFYELLHDIDLSQLITVTRQSYAVADDGSAIALPCNTFQVRAVVQPAPPETSAVYLPEGERTNSSINVWTTETLTVGVDGTGADTIAYQGNAYRVTKTTIWKQAGEYCQALCVQAPP